MRLLMKDFITIIDTLGKKALISINNNEISSNTLLYSHRTHNSIDLLFSFSLIFSKEMLKCLFDTAM